MPKTGMKKKLYQVICHRADAHHQDGRETDAVDFAHETAAELHAAQRNRQLVVVFEVKEEAERRADGLADHGGDGGAGRAHRGQAQPAEDEHRVEHDVRDGAGHLRPHAEPRQARGLQKALNADLEIQKDRADRDDLQIAVAEGADLGVGGLGVDKGLGGEQAEYGHQRPAAQRERHGVSSDAARTLAVAAAQGARGQRADADAGAGAESDHDILRREGQRQRRQAVFRHPGHIDAVHHVVQRLHQHRQHHRHGQAQQQPPLVLGAHAAGIQLFSF